MFDIKEFLLENRTVDRRELNEAMTRKDFQLMAREIRNSPAGCRDALVSFAIRIATTQNPRFDAERFRAAVETGKGI